ncbi:transposase IS4 family protein [Thiorhodococcus drewsii AZ1]|uniref:Transposase IS4 family protein n=1 Tax=Thiorhodococcus drewsii AZ1 TaxID=765913 RepID=G2E8H6_9GAMM|nr:transposase [Thiorhodococcus drewsii]EGV27591.1 transposase IS4 family protein [Thiorhodococcus drewsii AZ1]
MLRQPRRLWGQTVFLSAKRLETNEWLFIVSESYSHQAIEEYAQRWTIETLFAALKSHGLHLEETHLTKPERLERLFALLTLTTLWAVHAGVWAHEQQPIRQKTLERPQFSFFRYGLDLLQRLITLQASFAAELLCVLGFMLDGRPFNVQHDMRRALY